MGSAMSQDIFVCGSATSIEHSHLPAAMDSQVAASRKQPPAFRRFQSSGNPHSPARKGRLHPAVLHPETSDLVLL